MSRVAVFLADGFEEVEAVTPIDYLRRAGIEVLVTCVGMHQPVGARGITVKPDILISELEGTLDGVILPGGMPGSVHLSESAEVRRICSSVMGNGGLVASICAAPAVALGSFGLLKGRKFTCYPGMENDVSDAEYSDENVVVDGNLITSRGPGTAGEFALALIRYLEGDQAAEKIGKGTLLYD